ncbi:Ku protein [Actinospica durhamensis]|nr:Ku protein [Actinospica durhamensis]
MPANWTGSIVFGMVSVPVQLLKATETHAGPKFHQVHEKDGGRIRLKRFCEAEDKEVPYAEIAKGYDLGEDEELILTPDDLDSLPIPSKGTIELLAFVDEDTFDPMQFDSAYYVAPSKRSPAKPYALLREAMRETGKVGVSKVTLTTRESLAILRVKDDLLVLHTMLWPDELRPAGVDAPSADVRADEMKMARTLMDALSENFEIDALHDEYREAVEALIESKAQGLAPSSTAKPAPASNVVDITAMLKRSIEAQTSRGDSGAGAKKRASGSAAKKSTTAATKQKPTATATKRTSAAKKTASKRTGTAEKAEKAASGRGGRKAG